MHLPFYGTASMTKSLRTDFVMNESVPGPGSYEVAQSPNSQETNKSMSITLKGKIEHGSCFDIRKTNAGPGSYEISEKIKSLNKSARRVDLKTQKYKRFENKILHNSDLNLPGSINPKMGYAFGFRDQVKIIQSSPGPIYNPHAMAEAARVLKISNTCRGFGFGEKNGIYQSINSVPGPGAYRAQGFIRESSEKWSIGKGKRKEFTLTNPLGPGQYNPKFMSSSQSFKLGGKLEEPARDVFNTGPGSYQIPDNKCKIGPKFTPNNREQSRQKNKEDSVSPMTYSPGRYLDNPSDNGFSLGARHQENEFRLADTPGPGAYQLALKQIKNVGGYMGRKSEQKTKECLQDNFYKYNPKLSQVSRESPKFTFSHGPKDKGQDVVRGLPSQMVYEVQSSIKKNCSYTMSTSKRFTDLRKEDAKLYKENQLNKSTIGVLPKYLLQK